MRAAISSASASRSTRRCTASGRSTARRWPSWPTTCCGASCGPSRPPSAFRAGSSAPCLRGLHNDPDARWPSMDALLATLVRSPRARGWWYVSATVAVGASVVATMALAPVTRPRPTCQVSADRFAGVWESHGTRRAAIERSFQASGKPHVKETFDSLARLLDGYVARWSGMYRDACEATNLRGEQSNEVLDLRMSCLRDRWNELHALSDVLVEGHAVVVSNAVAAATALTPIERCADVTSANSSVAAPGRSGDAREGRCPARSPGRGQGAAGRGAIQPRARCGARGRRRGARGRIPPADRRGALSVGAAAGRHA